jgi:hypothetical protein
MSRFSGMASGRMLSEDLRVMIANSPADGSAGRRPEPVPGSLGELRGRLDGVVSLPGRLFWSGPDPRTVRWDLSDRRRRRDLYEIVLVKGTLDDICALVNGPELIRLWDDMYLPPWVCAAWRPLVEAGDAAA